MAHCQQNDGIGEQILPNPIDTRPPRIKHPPPSHPFQFPSTSQQNTHHTRRQIRHTHQHMRFTPHVKEITRKTTIKSKVISTLTGTNFGQHKETLKTVYKQVIRPTLNYASPAWYSPLSQANKDIMQKLQNRSLRIITGCTATTPIYHLHNETKILTVKQHLEMIGTQFFSSTLNPNHPNHQLLHRQPPQRNKKMTPTLLYSNIFKTLPPPPPTQTSPNTSTQH